MKKTHRNVEFDVHRLDDGRWEWIAYPKLAEGDRFAGAVEGDEEKATAAARAAIDARLGSVSEPRESARPFQPDPSQWGTAARIATSHSRPHSQRNDALLNSGGSQVFPPPEPKATSETAPMSPGATVNTPAVAGAGTAPREITGEIGHRPADAALPGAGSLAANADVASAQRRVTTTITANLAANLPDNRAIAHGLLQVTEATIAELREARFNDPETASLIELLEWLAKGLTQLVENLDRAIANPSEPMFLGTAGEIAGSLKRGLVEAVEKHRVRIWEAGAVLGVGWFLSSLSGESFSEILKILRSLFK